MRGSFKRGFRQLRERSVQEKAGRVLGFISLSLLLIILRIWYLSIVRYDDYIEKSRRPQTKLITEKSERATICDRYHIPMAINQVQYHAAVLYSKILEVPKIVWSTGEDGKRVKIYKRRQHIKELVEILGDELHLDPERIEDLIYSKAAIFHQVPYIIKRNISEEQYYRLRMMEKDWPGIHALRSGQRFYPLGCVGCDIIGYMGAINKEEYEGLIGEKSRLEAKLRDVELGEPIDLPEGMASVEDIRLRLQELEELAYTMDDFVGKTGVEGYYEEMLRGYRGQRRYFSNAKGNLIKELPGSSDPLPGERLILTISAELQEFAEKLLMEYESNSRGNSTVYDSDIAGYRELKEPWIKGGAIVAIDPNNGEVLALASYPRFDPNDFIPSGDPETMQHKQARVQRWLESEQYLGEIWDLKRPLEQEVFDPLTGSYKERQLRLGWKEYLDFILPIAHPIRLQLQKLNKISDLVLLLNSLHKLREASGLASVKDLIQLLYMDEDLVHDTLNLQEKILAREHLEQASLTKESHALNISLGALQSNTDKLFFLDLCQLIVDEKKFSPGLLNAIGGFSPEKYREASAAAVTIRKTVKEIVKTLYHDRDFADWRKEYGKTYLRVKRWEEKQASLYQKPYLDYFDRMEKLLFELFWEENQNELIVTFLGKKTSSDSQKLQSYFHQLNVWHQELSQGAHKGEEWYPQYQTMQAALLSVPLEQITPFLMSVRGYEDLTRPLFGSYRQVRKENGTALEKHLAAAFYPMYGYGHGRSYAFRQAAVQGSVFKIVTAYAALIQRFQELNGVVGNPQELEQLHLVDEKHRRPGSKFWNVGYWPDGKPIPPLYKGGRLMKSLSRNIGPVDTVSALEHSSNPYFSILAGDILRDPEDLNRTASILGFGKRSGIDLVGEYPGHLPQDLAFNRSGLYAYAIGQHSLVVTPLQTAVMLSAFANGGRLLQPKIVQWENDPPTVREEIEIPKMIKDKIFEGMRRVVKRSQTTGRFALGQIYRDRPQYVKDLISFDKQLIGKTGTAESFEAVDLDTQKGGQLYNHVWFGGIIFDQQGKSDALLLKDPYGNPELVVVVYFRYGKGGNMTIPIAAQIAKKWRDVKNARRDFKLVP